MPYLHLSSEDNFYLGRFPHLLVMCPTPTLVCKSFMWHQVSVILLASGIALCPQQALNVC